MERKKIKGKHCCIQSLLSLVLVAEFTVTKNKEKKKVTSFTAPDVSSSTAAGVALTDTEFFSPRPNKTTRRPLAEDQ